MVRIIDRITHISGRHAEREIEYHVRNASGRDFNLLYLPLTKRVQNLRVFDEDGARLNIAPDRAVKEFLEKLRVRDEAAYDRFIQRFKHVERPVLVRFPKNRALGAHSSRIITFRFEFDEPVETRGFLSRRNGVVPIFFTVPWAELIETRYPGHPHSYQFVVIGPADTYVRWRTRVMDLHGKDLPQDSPIRSRVQEFGEDGRSRTFTVRMEGAQAQAFKCSVEYDFRPVRRATATALAVLLVASLGVAIVSTVAHWVPWAALGVLEGTVKTATQAITGTAAASSVAVLSQLNDDWMDRYKILLLWSVTANVAVWLSWSL